MTDDIKLLETFISARESKELEECLRLAKNKSNLMEFLSNAQLSGIENLAADLRLNLNSILAELEKRNAKRWISSDQGNLFSAFIQDIDKLEKISEQVFDGSLEDFQSIYQHEPQGLALSQGEYAERIHLDFTRQYLRAAVAFCKIGKED